jgi:hypothetical protein
MGEAHPLVRPEMDRHAGPLQRIHANLVVFTVIAQETPRLRRTYSVATALFWRLVEKERETSFTWA